MAAPTTVSELELYRAHDALKKKEKNVSLGKAITRMLSGTGTKQHNTTLQKSTVSFSPRRFLYSLRYVEYIESKSARLRVEAFSICMNEVK